MRRHPKASSAGPATGRSTLIDRYLRGAAASRGTSDFADGSGAPSARRGAICLSLLTAAFALALLIAPTGAGAMSFIETFGSAQQPTFTLPADVEVEQGTGDVLVGDLGSNEVQSLKIEATAGQFKLCFEAVCTGDLAWNAAASSVRTALGALSTVGGTANLTVQGAEATVSTPGTYTITFHKKLGNRNVAQITTAAGTTPLSGSTATATAGTTAQGTVRGVYRFKPNGEPDPFSALSGSNVIDGISGPDEVPGVNEVMNTEGETAFEEAQIAVAPPGSAGGTAGDIYVTNGENGEVDIFAPTGAFIGKKTSSFPCGVAVGPAGDVYVGAYSDGVYKLTPTAPATFTQAAGSPFAGSEVCNVAAGAGPTAGFVFATSWNGHVVKIDSEGAEEGQTKYTVASGEYASVAVDPLSGRVFSVLSRFEGAAGSEVKEYDASGASPVETGHFETSGATPAQGIGISSSGKAYVSAGTQLQVFGDIPTVTTTAGATNVTTKEATVAGSVNPNGHQIETGSCKVEYGTTTAYGATAPCSPADPGAGSSPVPVTAQLSGLTPHTVYDFRFVATNAAGSGQGANQTFETAELLAPAVVTEAATGTGKTTTTLNGTVNPEFEEVSDCHFEYGLTAAYGQTAPCSPAKPGGSGNSAAAASAAISGLTPNTEYHFRLVATNAGGTTNGADETVQTTPDNKPVVTTTPGATNVTQTSAKVAGTVNPNGLAVTSCKVKYGTTAAYGSEVDCDSLPPGSGSSPLPVTGSLSGLTVNTTYHFRVFATNSDGTSEGSDQEFTTLPNAPTVTTTAGATSIAQTTATVAGSVNPNGGNVTACKVEYGLTTGYGSEAACSSLPGSGTSPVAVSKALSGLTANTTYHFRFVATNAGGSGQGSDQEFTTLPNAPTVTTTAGATSITQTTATVAGSVNPNAGNVTACKVEYGLTTGYGSEAACSSLPGSGTSPVAESKALSGLEANKTYHFRFVATNAGGTGQGSDQTLTTLPNAPTVTTTAGATSIAQTTATVAGTVNPNGGNVTQANCKVEYGLTAAYGSQAQCGSAPGAGTSPVSLSRTLSGLTANTTYHFRYVATNSGGTGQGSDQTFTTLPNAPTVTTTAGANPVAQTTATVAGSVNPNGGNVTACKVEYGTTPGYGSEAACASLPGSGTSPAAVSTALTGLGANTTYHFRFVATNASGTSSGSDQTFTTLANTCATDASLCPPAEAPKTCANTPSLCPPPSTAITLGAAKSKGKVVLLKVTVPGAGHLVATGKHLVKAKGSAKAAGTVTLKLKLNGTGKRQLKKKGKLKVKVKVVFTPTGGSPGMKTKTVTFKAKR